ncbi:hypothetical protein QBC36DRAFT_364740 [Triangularia setosa]|uniref:Extracellular membrane protein CFEM domain-containing protein n=1 Tax=Triangularia setosa TaxID=2587417 RepID=A0AAN7A1J9_9PEZI|nr:hypothetical protein QBC36DRAFT_364740 [Podospora setosa]
MTPRFAFPLCFCLSFSIAVADGILSLGADSNFNKLRACALDCYNGGVRDGYMVMNKLSCQKPGVGYVPPDNDCFCRPDLQEIAVRYVSTCVYTSCGQNQVDVASATQVYKDYCTSAGYTAATPKSTPVQTTAGSEIVGTTPSSSGSRLIVNTDAPNSNDLAGDNNDIANTSAPATSEPAGDNKGTSGLGTGAIVGICAGVVSAIAAVIGCVIKYKQYKKQKHQVQEGYLNE